MKRIYNYLLLATFAIVSCQKEELKSELKPSTQIRLSDVKFAMIQSTEVPKRKDEVACIIDNKAGTKCFESVGNSCSELQSCTAVSTMAASGDYTKAEIDQSIKIVKEAYGVEYVY